MPETTDGGFMESTFNAVGDPYFDPPRARVHESKGKRQFQTNNPKVGQTADNWGDGARVFYRLSDNEPYAEPYRREMDQRLENIKGMITPNGFRYSNPSEQQSSAGDYFGAFGAGMRNEAGRLGKPYDHFSDGTHGVRQRKTKIEEIGRRNILTHPGKKGSFGYVGTKLGGQEAEYSYSEDPYDATRDKHKAEIKEHHSLVGDRKPFKSMCHAVDFFDGMEHTAASKVYSWDDKCSMASEGEQEKWTAKQRVEHNADGVLKESFKAFVPSSFTKSHHDDATFEKFPEYMPTEFSEKMLRKYMMPDRNGPVKEMMLKHGMTEAMMERKAFRPNSFSKSKLTPSVCIMNISKHSV